MRLEQLPFHRLLLLCVSCWVGAFLYVGLMAESGIRETGFAWIPAVVLFFTPVFLVSIWASRTRLLKAWHPGRFVLLWIVGYLCYRPVAAFGIGRWVALVITGALLALTWFGVEHRLRAHAAESAASPQASG